MICELGNHYGLMLPYLSYGLFTHLRPDFLQLVGLENIRVLEQFEDKKLVLEKLALFFMNR